MTDTQPDLKTLRAARRAVRLFYCRRVDPMATDGMIALTTEILATSLKAVASGIPIKDEDWLRLAGAVDAQCDAEALPRLFQSRSLK